MFYGGVYMVLSKDAGDYSFIKKEAMEFAKSWWEHKAWLQDLYFSKNDKQKENLCAALIADLDLAEDKKPILYKLLDTALTDALYTTLLGLDGSMPFGGSMQQVYKITNENGEIISECGDLEAAAYYYFYKNPNEQHTE
jgi:hypothetical protein